MNIHEYQAKQLLAKHGVPVPAGEACATAKEAKAIAERLISGGHKRVVVKSQIHAGGRGKGVFKSGTQGGIKLCNSADEAFEAAGLMLGQVLVTKQTGPNGRQVNRLLIESAAPIKKEFYLAVLLDRDSSLPLVMASTEGGVDIEETAQKSPEKIIKEFVDPAIGLMPYQARKLAASLGLNGELLSQASRLFQGIYEAWWRCDATLVEVNPLGLVEQSTGLACVVIDAKIGLDDNSLSRQPEILAMRDFAEESPLEIEASKHNLNYIKLDGNIACMVNGAGLAMATMDIIKNCGGQPANFLDVGGSANKDQVAAAFKIILGDPNVKGILVNIFGGIMQCDVIAHGIVAAAKETRVALPLVVRLAGANADIAGKIIKESELPVISADSLAEAAEKVVAAVI